MLCSLPGAAMCCACALGPRPPGYLSGLAAAGLAHQDEGSVGADLLQQRRPDCPHWQPLPLCLQKSPPAHARSALKHSTSGSDTCTTEVIRKIAQVARDCIFPTCSQGDAPRIEPNSARSQSIKRRRHICTRCCTEIPCTRKVHLKTQLIIGCAIPWTCRHNYLPDDGRQRESAMHDGQVTKLAGVQMLYFPLSLPLHGLQPY